NGQGIPLAHTGGLHYDSKWNDKKESVNANYKIGSLEVDGLRNTINQNSLPGGVQNNNSNQSFNNYIFRQKADVRYDLTIDSSSTLKVSVDGTLRNNRTTNAYESATLNADNQLLNSSSRSTNNEGNGRNFNANVLWNKRFRKKGRTVSINMDQRLNTN